jgi:hypothetical protein
VTASTTGPSLCGEVRKAANAQAAQHDHSYSSHTRRYGPDPHRSRYAIGASVGPSDRACSLAIRHER